MAQQGQFETPIQETYPGGRVNVIGRGFVPSSFRISHDDGTKYGFTPGCPGCVRLQNKMGERRGHIAEGRSRFADLMGRDEDDKDRVQGATARQSEWMATEGEAVDSK